MIPGFGCMPFEEGDTLLDLMERHAEFEEEISDQDNPDCVDE